MKTISPELQAALARDTLFMAWCVRLDRRDGVSLGFTEHDRVLNIAGLDYEPTSGVNLSALANSATMAVDNADVDAFLASARITESDLMHGVYDGALLTVFLVDWSDVSLGVVILATGTLGEVSTGAVNFRAEFRGRTQRLQQTIGRRIGVECDADLGDSRCTKNLSAFTHSATVLTVVKEREIFTVDTGGVGAGDDSYFDYGTLDFTNGDERNTQMSFRIRGWDGDGTVTLAAQTPDPIQINDTLTMVEGCDKKAETCKLKFDNFLNYQGFPDVPGRDEVMERPSAK